MSSSSSSSSSCSPSQNASKHLYTCHASSPSLPCPAPLPSLSHSLVMTTPPTSDALKPAAINIPGTTAAYVAGSQVPQRSNESSRDASSRNAHHSVPPTGPGMAQVTVAVQPMAELLAGHQPPAPSSSSSPSPPASFSPLASPFSFSPPVQWRHASAGVPGESSEGSQPSGGFHVERRPVNANGEWDSMNLPSCCAVSSVGVIMRIVGDQSALGISAD